jgi:hypothetical protein
MIYLEKRATLWYPRFKRTTPTLLEFGGNSLSGYNTERGAFRKDMLMPEIFSIFLLPALRAENLCFAQKTFAPRRKS